MHYDAVRNDHGLPHDPFKALVAPRPIGWISTLDPDGVVNLAPYSFFNAVSARPNYVMFASEEYKDSVRNIEATGEFTCSLATWDLRFAMNLTSAPVPRETDEYEVSELTPAPSRFVKPPRVAESPAALECRLFEVVELPDADRARGTGHFVVIGHVVGVYIDDAALTDGRVDTARLRPIARMGYMDYAVVTPETAFTLVRPAMSEDGTVAKPSADVWDGTYR